MTNRFPHIPDFAWISHALPLNYISSRVHFTVHFTDISGKIAQSCLLHNPFLYFKTKLKHTLQVMGNKEFTNQGPRQYTFDIMKVSLEGGFKSREINAVQQGVSGLME